MLFKIKSYLCLQVMKIRTKIPGLHGPQMVLPCCSCHATFVFNPQEKKQHDKNLFPPKTNMKSTENESFNV